jgi:hypothetical protein
MELGHIGLMGILVAKPWHKKDNGGDLVET